MRNKKFWSPLLFMVALKLFVHFGRSLLGLLILHKKILHSFLSPEEQLHKPGPTMPVRRMHFFSSTFYIVQSRGRSSCVMQFMQLLSRVPRRATVVCVRESTKPILCCKWGYFERSKPILKILLASWTFYTVENEFRSFTAKNLGSVGQRAAKLLAIKLWEWLDPRQTQIQANWFEWGQGRAADFFLRPPTLIVSIFKAL